METERDIQITTRRLRPEAGLIEISGELSLAAIERFKAALDEVSEREVLIDLSLCQFIDSTAIAILLLRHRQMAEKGRRLVACSPSREVERILEVTGLTQQGGLVFGSVPEALAASPL